jgi:hypothetical protein
MKLVNLTLLVTITSILAVGIGQATPVLPGGTVFNDVFFASQDVTLEASNSGAWSLGTGMAAASGTYTDAVYKNVSGTLDFVYQFTNSATSNVGITETTGYSFTGFSTDVGYLANGGSLPGGVFVNGSTVTPGIPDDVSRSGDGSTVTFNFNVFSTADNIGPGMTSAVLMVSTNATKYAKGPYVGLITSGATTLVGFQPTSMVPEPSSMLPLGALFLAVGGIAVMKRRRRAQIVS